MAVLLQVQACHVQFIRAGCFFGRRRFSRRGREFRRAAGLRRVGDDLAAFARNDPQPAARQRNIPPRPRGDEGFSGSQVRLPLQGPAFAFQADDRLWKWPGNADPDADFFSVRFQMEGGVEIGVMGRPDFLDGIPKLAP